MGRRNYWNRNEISLFIKYTLFLLNFLFWVSIFFFFFNVNPLILLQNYLKYLFIFFNLKKNDYMKPLRKPVVSVVNVRFFSLFRKLEEKYFRICFKILINPKQHSSCFLDFFFLLVFLFFVSQKLLLSALIERKSPVVFLFLTMEAQ